MLHVNETRLNVQLRVYFRNFVLKVVFFEKPPWNQTKYLTTKIRLIYNIVTHVTHLPFLMVRSSKINFYIRNLILMGQIRIYIYWLGQTRKYSFITVIDTEEDQCSIILPDKNIDVIFALIMYCYLKWTTDSN